VTRPAIGISYMSAAQARALGVDYGVLVLDVPSGSLAAEAGLKGSYRSSSGEVVLGDVITAVNRDAVKTDLDLFRAIDKYAPGETVTLTVARLSDADGGQRLEEKELRLPIQLQEYFDDEGGYLPLTGNWGVRA